MAYPLEATIRFDLDQVKKDSVLLLSEGCTGLLAALLTRLGFFSADTNLVCGCHQPGVLMAPGELGRQGDQ